jgi:hypothetical protein
LHDLAYSCCECIRRVHQIRDGFCVRRHWGASEGHTRMLGVCE